MGQESAWHLIDADGRIVGRLANRIAILLRGKHKPTFSPHLDEGDHVVVVNVEKVRFTGKKWDQKVYYRHSGYPGAIKSEKASHLLRKKPERILYDAVMGMLPKNKLRKRMLRKLRLYVGPTHPHIAQNPTPLEP